MLLTLRVELPEIFCWSSTKSRSTPLSEKWNRDKCFAIENARLRSIIVSASWKLYAQRREAFSAVADGEASIDLHKQSKAKSQQMKFDRLWDDFLISRLLLYRSRFLTHPCWWRSARSCHALVSLACWGNSGKERKMFHYFITGEFSRENVFPKNLRLFFLDLALSQTKNTRRAKNRIHSHSFVRSHKSSLLKKPAMKMTLRNKHQRRLLKN